MKAYAPTVAFPEPVDCPFEDFVYMASLLKANIITALPHEREPIQYLRRLDSICGKRESATFTDHIPSQLERLFLTVLQDFDNVPQDEKDTAVKMVKGFVLGRLTQFGGTLQKIIDAGFHSGVDQRTLEIFNEKADALRQYISAVSSSQALGSAAAVSASAGMTKKCN